MSDSQIDISKLKAKFDSLVSRKQHDLMYKSVNDGANLLLKYTRESLLAKFPKASYVKGKANKTMLNQVHVGRDKAYLLTWVSVLNYLTKWYETGVQPRALLEDHEKDSKHKRTYKKGENRGSFKGLWYFREARHSHADEVVDSVKDSILTNLKNEFDNA